MASFTLWLSADDSRNNLIFVAGGMNVTPTTTLTHSHEFDPKSREKAFSPIAIGKTDGARKYRKREHTRRE